MRPKFRSLVQSTLPKMLRLQFVVVIGRGWALCIIAWPVAISACDRAAFAWAFTWACAISRAWISFATISNSFTRQFACASVYPAEGFVKRVSGLNHHALDVRPVAITHRVIDLRRFLSDRRSSRSQRCQTDGENYHGGGCARMTEFCSTRSSFG